MVYFRTFPVVVMILLVAAAARFCVPIWGRVLCFFGSVPCAPIQRKDHEGTVKARACRKSESFKVALQSEPKVDRTVWFARVYRREPKDQQGTSE
jgi:hypothetical protein